MAGVGTTPNPTTPGSSLVTPAASTTPAQTGSGQSLGATAFLSLLTTELQNQDPLNPMDDTQSVTQLAQFQALQSQLSMTDSFNNFQSNFAISQAASLIGMTVSVNTPNGANGTSSQSGVVTGVQVVNGVPEIALSNNGQIVTGSNGSPMLFQLNQITAVVPSGSSSSSGG
jgi:flagellar basal-body rod modification protein FlgD